MPFYQKSPRIATRWNVPRRLLMSPQAGCRIDHHRRHRAYVRGVR
jgi:hypothetical protein